MIWSQVKLKRCLPMGRGVFFGVFINILRASLLALVCSLLRLVSIPPPLLLPDTPAHTSLAVFFSSSNRVRIPPVSIHVRRRSPTAANDRRPPRRVFFYYGRPSTEHDVEMEHLQQDRRRRGDSLRGRSSILASSRHDE